MPGTRVVVLADDLIWSTRLVAAVRAAGHEATAVRASGALAAAVAGVAANGPAGRPIFVIVDLTARAYEGVEAIEVAKAAGATILAIGQHDDIPLRKRALAAGASKVLAYRKLAVDGPATIRAWIDATSPVTSPEPTAATATR